MTNPITAVWVYWAGGADADELRYSMRSVAKHFVDLKNIVLCGDREPWYNGDFIESPKWTKAQAKAKHGTGRWAKWTDSVIKLQRIIDSPLVTDQFLWLYDDTFFMRDITAAEASIHRRTRLLCARPESKASGTWREVLRRTTQALHEAGRPARNYSHHGPVVFDKHLLQQTIDKFDPLNRPRAIESLYINHHFDEDQTQPLAGWMSYTQKPSPTWKPSPNAAVINVGGFRKSVQRVIQPCFPDPSPVEATDAPALADRAKPAPKPAPNHLPQFPAIATTYREATPTLRQKGCVTFVTTHFNFARYKRTAKTYYEWLPKLPLEIASRVICYECVLDDDAPEINGSIVVRGTREKNYLWQKEALLQIALEQCTTPLFCWIDHDTYHLPEDSDWLEQATKLLTGDIHAVQLFREFHHYDEAGTPTQQKRNMFTGGFSPGGAWIAETDFLRSIGGFPRIWITGSGDYHLYERMKENATYLDVSAHHIWHGDLVNRRYQERHKAIDDLGFNFAEDIGFAANGLAYWRTDKPGLRQAVRDYFINRQEDGEPESGSPVEVKAPPGPLKSNTNPNPCRKNCQELVQ
ncbi:MAG: hypothetical protein ACF788_03955 [Novipirellula sp. JB048]